MKSILASKNWPTIYFLALSLAKAYPNDPNWPEIAQYAASQIPAARIPQTPSHLPPADQQRLQGLSNRVAEWGRMAVKDRAEAGSTLMFDVKKFTREFPDLTVVWLMQAHLASSLNKPVEGRVAANNLDALRAWESTRPEVLALLMDLLVRGWTPSQGLAEEARKTFGSLIIERLKLDAEKAPQQPRLDLLKRIKAFNLVHPEHAYGWLLQYDVARSLSRKPDEMVAWGRLHPPHGNKTAAPPSTSRKSP